MHAVFTMVAAAVESVSAFEHTDPAFTADAPSLPATEPALAFIRASRGRLRTSPRQDHSSDATVGGGLFIASGCESAITGGQVRRAAEDGLMAIQRRRPQGDVGRSRGVHVVPRDDLMFRFLNGDQLAELVRLRNLTLANRLGVRFEPNSFGLAILLLRIVSVCGSNTLSTLSGTWVSPPRMRARV